MNTPHAATATEYPETGGRARLMVLAALGALALAAGLLLARGATVRGESMAPALHGGERLLVETASHRLRAPARGDIVVVQVSDETWLLSSLSGGRFVKRVVGLPGATIEIRGGRVLIDGSPLAEPYAPDPAPRDVARTAVPADAYYVLGDNRGASDDSRTWGPVARTAVDGRVWLVLGAHLRPRLA